jgi:hypothetical protein
MESALRDATESNEPSTWMIVVGHYPIVSAGDHGDVEEMKSNLLPLLLKYKVHAYFCGHDHVSEHLEYDGLHNFVVGAGSMTDTLKGSTSADLIWGAGGYNAFAVVTVDTTQFTVRYYDDNVSNVYTYSMLPISRRPTSLPTAVPAKAPIVVPAPYRPTASPSWSDGRVVPHDDDAQVNHIFTPTPLKVGMLAASVALVVGLIFVTLRFNTKQRKLVDGYTRDLSRDVSKRKGGNGKDFKSPRANISASVSHPRSGYRKSTKISRRLESAILDDMEQGLSARFPIGRSSIPRHYSPSKKCSASTTVPYREHVTDSSAVWAVVEAVDINIDEDNAVKTLLTSIKRAPALSPVKRKQLPHSPVLTRDAMLRSARFPTDGISARTRADRISPLKASAVSECNSLAEMGLAVQLQSWLTQKTLHAPQEAVIQTKEILNVQRPRGVTFQDAGDGVRLSPKRDRPNR